MIDILGAFEEKKSSPPKKWFFLKLRLWYRALFWLFWPIINCVLIPKMLKSKFYSKCAPIWHLCSKFLSVFNFLNFLTLRKGSNIGAILSKKCPKTSKVHQIEPIIQINFLNFLLHNLLCFSDYRAKYFKKCSQFGEILTFLLHNLVCFSYYRSKKK